MDGEKGKSEADDSVLRGSPKRAREDGKGEETTTTTTTVTDEEVEEFFAILRRIHVAVNYFKKGSADGNGDIDGRLTWMRKAESQNWGKNSAGKGDKKEEENIVGLDLNADPGTGSDPF